VEIAEIAEIVEIAAGAAGGVDVVVVAAEVVTAKAQPTQARATTPRRVRNPQVTRSTAWI